MALLFAVGVSIGMANKTDGTSALAGLVAWLSITTLLKPETIATLQGLADASAVNPAFGKVENVFVGIIAGLIAAWSYNTFKDTKLPDALSFFSGRRSVAIVTAGLSLIVAVILMFVWPVVFGGLVTFGEWIATLGPVGAGIFGTLNRLLIPFGLHHALNSVFWFDVAGINDLTNFLAGTGEYGVTGQYMTGFFPIMMFGLPGAALAMYRNAKSTRKKVTYGIMLSAAISAFFVGVTEPLEFAFMFVAPWLYLVHAIFTGISMTIAAMLPTRLGFGFSAGFIDMILQWVNPMTQNPWILLLLGVGWFFVYYLTFSFLIRKFDLKTPGREDDDPDAEEGAGTVTKSGYREQAIAFIRALGGKANIVDLDNCATRLRMELADVSKVDDQALKRAGAAGTMKPGGKSVQVIVGLNVQFVKDAMESIIHSDIEVPDAALALASVSPGASSGTLAPEPEAEESVTVTLRQPVAGRVIPLAEVPDPTFAGGSMGPGVAIDPTGDTIVAPADGTVVALFPTGHAVGLKLTDGTEVLIHIGIDTVSLKGDGFTKLVKQKDAVTAGQPLVRFDAAKIRAAGLSPVTPVIVLNNKNATVRFV